MSELSGFTKLVGKGAKKMAKFTKILVVLLLVALVILMVMYAVDMGIGPPIP